MPSIVHFPLIRPAHANKLVNEEKITSIEALRVHPKRNQLLNKTQQLGLKYLDELEEKIPRDEMQEMEVSRVVLSLVEVLFHVKR